MTKLQWRTAGESHGPTLIGIVEGIPAGLALDVDRINLELERRQGGYGRGGRMRIETDRVEILSGWRAGETIGAPIAFAVKNKDAVIERLPVPTNPRPGHADLAGCQKWGHRDPRAVLERASARETAARVAAAGICRQVLEAFGIEVFGYLTGLGGVVCDGAAWDRAGEHRGEIRASSDFMSLDPAADEAMRAAVDAARAAKDSLGGTFEIRALGLPPGLGSCASASERLTGRLGGALFSIPAIKGVEVGIGFDVGRLRGSEVHDPIVPGEGKSAFDRATNRAGGLEGGMSTGEPLVLRAAMKPIPSIRLGMPTVDLHSGEPVQATYQRSDVTSVPACSVVGEAMVALVLTEAFLEKYGGDSMGQVRAAYEYHQAEVQRLGRPEES